MVLASELGEGDCVQLAVFDLDHTLLNANVSFKFGQFLHNQKQITTPTLLICLLYYFSHKVFGLSIEKVHHKIFQHLFLGKSIAELNRQVDLFLDQTLPSMLNDEVIERLHLEQQKGHYTLILSSSPDFLVNPIARFFGVTEWKSSVYDSDADGKLSTIKLVMEGEEKARIAAALMAKLGISHPSVTVFSDSHLDLPILMQAGKAIAVKPDRILRKICKMNDWEIIS